MQREVGDGNYVRNDDDEEEQACHINWCMLDEIWLVLLTNVGALVTLVDIVEKGGFATATATDDDGQSHGVEVVAIVVIVVEVRMV